MIVVDSNAIAYILLDAERTTLAQEVARADPDWRVPQLWRHAFLNVLAIAAREGAIDPPQADTLWRTGLDLLGGGGSRR